MALKAREVARDELALVVAPSHRWARRRRVRAAELVRTPLVSRKPGSATRQAWEQAVCERLDTDLAAPILEVSSTTAIKAAVMGGIGPAVLSVRAVTPNWPPERWRGWPCPVWISHGECMRSGRPGTPCRARPVTCWPSHCEARSPDLHCPAKSFLPLRRRRHSDEIPWLIAPHNRHASGPISAGYASISDSTCSIRPTTHTMEL
jgi:DNA-binding transcriptional LysR family regulator